MGNKARRSASRRGRQNRLQVRQMTSDLRQEADAQQRAADFARRYRRWVLRRISGYCLGGLGVVIILVHVVMHLGNITVIPLQDLLIGYPTGAVFIVVGLIIGGQRLR
jgi:hypothetical protein